MNVACNGFEIDEKKRVTVCDEGEVVLFNPPVEGKVTEIYVTVLPKQRGTGDPTPSNIRPIEGYDRAVIHHLTDLREVDYVSNLKDVVYAGTIDLEKGIVTTEYAILNIDGSKTVGTVTNHPNSFTYSLGETCIAPNARGVQSTGWCTHYKVLTDVNSAEFYSEDKSVAYANTSLSAVVGRAIFTDTDYSSATDFKAVLQEQASKGTPVQIVFRLNEPVTFECDPLSIRTVSGNNHLVSEDGIIHACLEYFEGTEEPSESVTMPFGCQVGCTVSEYHTVEPLPVEEREPKDVCPPGMPNKWDIDDIPHAEGYCEGQGMDCVCNPMAIVTGIPCYKTIYVDSLPEEGMSGVMYVMPFEDKYAVYIWDGNEFQSATSTAVIEPLSVTPSSSAQDIEPVGADGFSPVHVDAVPQGALAPPTIEYGTNLGSGVIWSHSSVGVGGYIQQGQSIDRFDYCSQILPTENGKTVTPTTSQQVAVNANKWTNGQIKVGPIPSEYIIPSGTKQITENGTDIDVAAYEKVDVNVSGGGITKAEGDFTIVSESNENFPVLTHNLHTRKIAVIVYPTGKITGNGGYHNFYTAWIATNELLDGKTWTFDWTSYNSRFSGDETVILPSNVLREGLVHVSPWTSQSSWNAGGNPATIDGGEYVNRRVVLTDDTVKINGAGGNKTWCRGTYHWIVWALG